MTYSLYYISVKSFTSTRNTLYRKTPYSPQPICRSITLNHSKNQTFLGKFIEANKAKSGQNTQLGIWVAYCCMLTTNYEEAQQHKCLNIQTES